MAQFRRILTLLTIGALIGMVVLWINPIHSRLMKLAFLAASGFGWAGLLFLYWKKKALCRGLLIIPVLLAIPFLLPGRSIDAGKLRSTYLLKMQSYEGTNYHWGGENGFGIDCSGLPRRAYRDSLYSYGIRHGNGKACRMFLEQWMYDSSAKALGEGYRGFTTPVGISGKIRDMKYEELLPGDLAVTKSGAHILAYLGDGKWIQADPGAGKVITLDGRTVENIWFDTMVTTHRWSGLVEL